MSRARMTDTRSESLWKPPQLTPSPVKTSLEDTIRERIASRGRISFAEFMELALYHPEGGYYAGASPVGASGDYFTSAVAHPAFGALVAVQLRRMWELLGCPATFRVVEAGAGTARLAQDVVGYAPVLSEEFAQCLRYVALDRHATSLGGAGANIEQVVASTVPMRGVAGCFISNELIDSFPVHRFRIVDGEVAELFVELDGRGRLVEGHGPPSTPMLLGRLQELAIDLPEGFQGEVNLMAGPWLAGVAEALDSGFVLTIDYGYSARELYSPARSAGTLRTYRNHLPADSPLRHVGQTDITAHVDFSLLSSEGERHGLKTLSLTSQERFLRGMGFDRMMASLRRAELSQRERDANAMGMRQLVDPQGLGGFKVLVQEKGTGVRKAAELLPQGVRETDVDAPLLQSGHISLLEGRYPHAGGAPEHLWPWQDSAKD